MLNNILTLGTKVQRLASDYTNGRRGEVIELDDTKKRARVLWTHTPSGAEMKLRTWVRFADLSIIERPTVKPAYVPQEQVNAFVQEQLENQFDANQADPMLADTWVQWVGSSVLLWPRGATAGQSPLTVLTADERIVEKVQRWCVKNHYRCGSIVNGKIQL